MQHLSAYQNYCTKNRALHLDGFTLWCKIKCCVYFGPLVDHLLPRQAPKANSVHLAHSVSQKHHKRLSEFIGVCFGCEACTIWAKRKEICRFHGSKESKNRIKMTLTTQPPQTPQPTVPFSSRSMRPAASAWRHSAFRRMSREVFAGHPLVRLVVGNGGTWMEHGAPRGVCYGVILDVGMIVRRNLKSVHFNL